MRMPKRICVAVVLLICPQVVRATILTNSRPGIAQMAGYWEVDSVQISSLVNSNYPAFSANWEFMQPSGSTATDGDEHINMCVNATGTGATGDNLGTESPLVAEIINAAGGLLPSGNTHAKTRGIFRYYHEHAGEVKYEIHPITERDTWNGSAWVFANDYHNNIRPVSDATTKALSTYTDLVQGNNQQVVVTVSSDNVTVFMDFPTGAGADTVNYVQYDGQVVQTLTSDSVSKYITFHATNSPAGAISGARNMRCRIMTNTVAATVAATLGSNQTVTVNVLNRVDMLGMSNVVASLGAGASVTITQPLEWITCGLTNVGPNVPPTAGFSGTPTSGSAPLTVTFSDTSAGNITNRFWDFGDTGTTNVTTNSLSHTYAAGTYNVKLIASGPGGSSTNTKTSYIAVSGGGPSPLVLSVTPSCGPTTGGTAITISGSNFVSGATVTIGGSAASSVVFVSDTTLTGNTPAGTAGAKNVVVTNPSTQLGTLVNGFSYTATPSPSNNGPICSGQTLNLSANTTATSYSWIGPNGFSSSAQNPSIANATTAATGTYSLTVTSGGCTSSAGTTTASVNPSPSVHSVTGGGSYCSGGSGVAVGLDGSDSGINYQLVRDGTTNVGSPVAGSGSAITFGNQTAAGTYTILASNTTTACTQTMSGSALVTINTRPTSVVSGSTTICAGGSTTIQAALTGTGPWNVTWSDSVTQNGVATSPATRNVSPTLTTTYTVTALTDANCTAQAGDLTGSAVVTVTSGTTITSNPSNQTACEGSTAAFSVAATGSSLTYQWQLSVSGGAFADISGATSSSYTTPATAAGDNGNQYRCVVSGACGAPATSTAATLTVNSRPTSVVSGTATICNGGSTTIQAALTGTGPWNVTWSDGNVQTGVAASPATRSVSPASSTTYTVTALTDANCTAQAGDRTGSAVVTVNTAPAITTQPQSQTVSEGSNVTFSVTATGTAPLTYQWRKGGGNISGATSSNYNLTAVTTNDAGSYDVIVSDSCGSVTSTAATLTVNVGSLPAPWLTMDIGAVGIAGSASASNGVYTVKGSGLGPTGTSDQFRYVYQTMSGDGSITARVNSQSGTTTTSLAGVMVRETTATGSRFAGVCHRGSGGNNTRAVFRTTTGGSTTTTPSTSRTPPNCWVRVTRTGNSFAMASSPDGTSWTTINTSTITMATDITVGIIVTSGSNTILDTDVFNSVTVVP